MIETEPAARDRPPGLAEVSDSNGTRNHALDGMRGILAFSIVLYHYLYWNGMATYPYRHFLGAFGIYSVEMFFVLSGASMMLAYGRAVSLGDFKPGTFLIRRALRILPLYAAVVVATMLLPSNTTEYGWQQILLNISGVFGFLSPDLAIPLGGWSIGIEMLCYLLFSLVAILGRRTVVWAVAALASSLLGVLWQIWAINPDNSLLSEWAAYVSPINHVFLFFLGALIVAYRGSIPAPVNPALAIGLSLLAILLGIQFCDDEAEMALGYMRFAILIPCCCIVAVLVLRGARPRLPVIGRPFQLLGMCSYSLYLVHPLIYGIGTQIAHAVTVSRSGLFALCLATALIASYVLFVCLERPFMRLAKEWTIRR